MDRLIILFVCICFGIIQASYTPISVNGDVGCVSFTEPSSIVSIGTINIINQTNFEVQYNLVPDNCIYGFVITQIEILVGTEQISSICSQEENVNISQYLITSNFRNLKTITRLNNDNNNNNNLLNLKLVSLDVQPILAQEITISRELEDAVSYCVSYGLSGYSLTTVAVLSYAISSPRVETQGDRGFDDTYTGWCNDELCYGGKGQLMDGIIGGNDDNSESFNIVGWRCFSDSTSIDSPCTFNLKIYLTGTVNVSEVVFYGYRTSVQILAPQINIVLYNITISPTVAMEILSNTYKINIPIGVITDIIDIEMVVMETKKLVLSEVQVFSEGVNIGPLDLGYQYSVVNKTTTTTTTTTTTAATIPAVINSTSATMINDCDYTVIYVVFSFIVVIQFLLLLLLLACCIYTAIKYKGMKTASKLSNNVNQTRTESAYSQKPNRNDSMYATIGSLARPNISNDSIATHQRNVTLPSRPSQEERLIAQSPQKVSRSSEYQNSDVVAIELSTSSYNVTENMLYDGNLHVQNPTNVVYGQSVNNQTDVGRILVEEYILISTVVILSCLLLLMGFVVLTLAIAIISLARGRKRYEVSMDNIIQSKLHESTMQLAENRIATYADIDEDEIRSFRSKLRERLMNQDYAEVNKGGVSDNQLFGRLMDGKSSPPPPPLVPILENDDAIYTKLSSPLPRDSILASLSDRFDLSC